MLVNKNILNENFVSDICASFQKNISKILIEKLLKTNIYLKKKI